MYFLIDYENVKSSGMKGNAYLLSEDTIELFFSDACPTIGNGIFEYMKKSGYEVRICKLQNPRKNALNSLKRFGRKNGVRIYNQMKQIVI